VLGDQWIVQQIADRRPAADNQMAIFTLYAAQPRQTSDIYQHLWLMFSGAQLYQNVRASGNGHSPIFSQHSQGFGHGPGSQKIEFWEHGKLLGR
jgi:hypothetical protein